MDDNRLQSAAYARLIRELREKESTLSVELAEALERERKHVATNSQAVSACERAQRELAEAVGLLSRLQWLYDQDAGVFYCADCNSNRHVGHMPSCALASFLAKVSR